MDLITALDKAMEGDRRPSRERMNHTAWDLGKCVRELFYKWVVPNEAEWKPDAGFQWKLRLGEAVEEIVTKWLSQANVMHINSKWDTWTHPELRWPLRYQIDLEIIDTNDGAIAVVDVKSGFGREISEMKRTGKPKRQYEEQLAFYTVARRRKRGYLLFVGRDSAYRTQRMYEWIEKRFMEVAVHNGEVVRDTEITFEAQLEKLKTLEAAVIAAGLSPTEHAPPRPEGYVMAIKNGEMRDDFQHESRKYQSTPACRYCSYKGKCWGPELANYANGNNVEMLKAAGIEGTPVKQSRGKDATAA